MPLIVRFLKRALPRRGWVLLGGLCLLGKAAPTQAQTDPRLAEAVRLAQEGQSDSARALVRGLMAAASPTDSLYPEMLYTMGLVSQNVEEMRRNYQRIAVEYASSPWADDALLRLAMLDYAARDPAGTVRQLERLRTDYPSTPLIPLASEWAARAYFDLKNRVDGCRWLSEGLARAGNDVELRSRLEFYQNRCQNLSATDTARGDSGAATAPGPVAKDTTAPAARSGWSVQVAAVGNQAAADGITGRLKAQGFTPHVVRESGYLKIRVGPFPSRAEAQQMGARIKAKLGGSPFLVKVP